MALWLGTYYLCLMQSDHPYCYSYNSAHIPSDCRLRLIWRSYATAEISYMPNTATCFREHRVGGLA